MFFQDLVLVSISSKGCVREYVATGLFIITYMFAEISKNDSELFNSPAVFCYKMLPQLLYSNS